MDSGGGLGGIVLVALGGVVFALNIIYSHQINCFNSIPPPQVEWLFIIAGRAIGVVNLTKRNRHALGATALVIIVYMIHVPCSRLV